MAKARTKLTKVTKTAKTTKASVDNTTLMLIAICSVLVGVMLGKVDTWIVDSLGDSSEWHGIIIMLVIAGAFAYAWFGGILLVRLFLQKMNKR